jgi:hypothetical protein
VEAQYYITKTNQQTRSITGYTGSLKTSNTIFSLTFAKIKKSLDLLFAFFFIIYNLHSTCLFKKIFFFFFQQKKLRFYYCITMMLFQRNPDLTSIRNFYVTTSSTGHDQPVAHGPGSIINGKIQLVLQKRKK